MRHKLWPCPRMFGSAQAPMRTVGASTSQARDAGTSEARDAAASHLSTAVASSRDVAASHACHCCCMQQRRWPAPAEWSYAVHAPAVSYVAPPHVDENIAPAVVERLAPAVSYTAPLPVVEYLAPAEPYTHQNGERKDCFITAIWLPCGRPLEVLSQFCDACRPQSLCAYSSSLQDIVVLTARA